MKEKKTRINKQRNQQKMTKSIYYSKNDIMAFLQDTA